MALQRSTLHVLCGALLLLIAFGHAIVAWSALRGKSTTADEIAHVTGGTTFNRFNDHRMHPENGWLPQRWAALAPAVRDASYPNPDSPSWQKGDVWGTGFAFFYGGSNDAHRLLSHARAFSVVWGVATILLIALWSWRLWGPVGALVSALLAAACPTMLAHTSLVTSDMAMTFFLLASASAFWWQLRDGRAGILLLSVATFGVACVAKFTAVLLLPIFGALIVLNIALPNNPLTARASSTPRPTIFRALLSLVAHGIGAWLVIWTFAGWRFAGFNPDLPAGQFFNSWDFVLSFGGWKASAINFLRAIHFLPEAYLYGFSFVLKYAELRGAFLDGDYSLTGWVMFFPKAFLYKTPPTLIAAIIGSLAWMLVKKSFRSQATLRHGLACTAPLWVLFGVYWLTSLASNLNIGHRHILPTYPVLYIFCGALGAAVVDAARQKSQRWLAAAGAAVLLGAHVATAAWIYPHHLAYFSPVAGGPRDGYKHLVDSSLDWGQDLRGLKTYLEQSTHRDDESIYLSYFGTGSPEYERIDAILLPRLPELGPRPRHLFRPGIYAISATMLQQVYSPVRGPWTAAREEQYRQLRANEPALLDENRPSGPDDPTPAQWEAAWKIYEPLRFARLCHYLRAREPDAMIGYSILIYHLTQQDLDAALNGPGPHLVSAIPPSTDASR